MIGPNLSALSAQADDTSDAIEKLKEQIQRLSQKVQHLERKHEAEQQRVQGFGQLSLDAGSLAHYATPGSAQGAPSRSVGLNWYLNKNIRCIFEAEQTAFNGGSKAPGALTAQDERVLMERLQFGF